VAFSYVPLRAASLLGFCFALFGLLYAAVIVLMAIFSGFQVQGWASLMVVLLVVAGVQLIMIGILGEYLWRALEETRRRPRYIVERVIGPAGQTAATKDDSCASGAANTH
jgi:dolichol-phosphate mannosyltransferase